MPAPTLATLIEAIETMNQVAPPTFPELLDRLFQLRYTGQITLNFAGGLPRNVVLSQPVQVPLDTG